MKDDEEPRLGGGSGDGGNNAGGGGGGSGGDGEGPEEGDSAREKSLQLGGGGGLPIGGWFSKYTTFLAEVREEMRKVTWPTRRMVITETIVVIIFVIFFTALITGLDHVFAMLFNKALFGHKFPWE